MVKIKVINKLLLTLAFVKYSTGGKSLKFDQFKLAIIETFKEHQKEKPTLTQRLHNKRKTFKNGKVNSTLEPIDDHRSKSTMKRDSVEVGLEMDIDKQTDSTRFKSIVNPLGILYKTNIYRFYYLKRAFEENFPRKNIR